MEKVQKYWGFGRTFVSLPLYTKTMDEDQYAYVQLHINRFHKNMENAIQELQSF